MQAPAAQYPYDKTPVGPASRVRAILNKTNDFEQAGMRYRSFDTARQISPQAPVLSFLCTVADCRRAAALLLVSRQHTAQGLASTHGCMKDVMPSAH